MITRYMNPVSISFFKESAEFIYEFVLTAQEDGWKLSTMNMVGIRFDENTGGVTVDFCKISSSQETFKTEQYKSLTTFKLAAAAQPKTR